MQILGTCRCVVVTFSLFQVPRMLTDADSPIAKIGLGLGLGLGADFLSKPRCSFASLLLGDEVHCGVCSRVEYCIRSMENGVQRESAWRGYCYVELWTRMG